MITILGIGKTKEQFLKEGINEYLKRLQKYASLKYKEMESIPETKGFTITLDIKGKEFSSEEFAEYLKKKTLEQKNITFVLGDSPGLPEEFLNKCQDRISLSKMTFPHQLVRLIFLEQLYRAFSIIHHEPYHK